MDLLKLTVFLALIPRTEKFSDLTSRGLVKKQELSKGQKTMADFAKTSTARAKEQADIESASGGPADSSMVEDEMDIEMVDGPSKMPLDGPDPSSQTEKTKLAFDPVADSPMAE